MKVLSSIILVSFLNHFFRLLMEERRKAEPN